MKGDVVVNQSTDQACSVDNEGRRRSDGFWAFWSAWMFLTRFPAPQLPFWSTRIMGLALYWYGAVGLLLGLVLTVTGWGLLQLSLPSAVIAALLLAFFVWLTGALHLDGLTDSIDAFAASHAVSHLGQKIRFERIQTVMKDPNVGALGASGLILQCLLKWSLLLALIEAYTSNTDGSISYWCLVIIPALARQSAHYQLLRLPYLSVNGLGSALTAYARFLPMIILLLLSVGVTLIGSGLFSTPKQNETIILVIVMLVVWLLVNEIWRGICARRLGGHTGDSLGAGIEIQETSLLLLMVIWISASPVG